MIKPMPRTMMSRFIRPFALAGAVLLGPMTLSLVGCNRARVTQGAPNPGGKYLELSFADLVSVLNKFSGKTTECDIPSAHLDLRIGADQNQRLGSLASELSRHIITVMYSPRRAESRDFIGQDLQIINKLKGLAPNQVEAVIERLAKSNEMASLVRDLNSLLSKEQRNELARACGKDSGGVPNLGTRLGGPIVLSGLTRGHILEALKDLPAPAEAGSCPPCSERPNPAPIPSPPPEVRRPEPMRPTMRPVPMRPEPMRPPMRPMDDDDTVPIPQ